MPTLALPFLSVVLSQSPLLSNASTLPSRSWSSQPEPVRWSLRYSSVGDAVP